MLLFIFGERIVTFNDPVKLESVLRSHRRTRVGACNLCQKGSIEVKLEWCRVFVAYAWYYVPSVDLLIFINICLNLIVNISKEYRKSNLMYLIHKIVNYFL